MFNEGRPRPCPFVEHDFCPSLPGFWAWGLGAGFWVQGLGCQPSSLIKKVRWFPNDMGILGGVGWLPEFGST